MWNGRPTDIVWFNGEEYELIACDNGENLLCSGNFVNKKRNEYIGICLGYIPIVYSVEEELLYGYKPYDQNETNECKLRDCIADAQKRSCRYDGSIIIARGRSAGNNFTSVVDDFFEFFMYKSAYELCFIEGRLTEINDLSLALEEFRNQYMSIPKGRMKRMDIEKQREVLTIIAGKYLICKYQ